MFHTSHIHVPRNRRPSALRTFITSSSFGPPDTKEPLRRGILLTAVAFVLLLIGSILTWLGFNDVFGGRMSMTGPLLIALSLLLLLLSFRQFLLARKRNSNNRSSMQLDSVNGDTMTAVVVNHDDGLRPATVIVDRYNRIGYDGAITVHRHLDEDCAPPSYHEVTQLSSSSNTPSCLTHDGQDEMPPTYEETMSSSIYPLAPLLPSSTQQDRGAGPPLPTPSVAVTQLGVSGGGGPFNTERGAAHGPVPVSAGCGFAPRANPRRSPPKPTVPCLQLQMGSGVVVGAVGNSAMSGPAVMQPTQHCLTLPVLHMSAPASPRQLSAPPSPHPFSAPPSPRHLNSQHNMTPPPQYMSPYSSSLQLSAPPSLHLLSASPSHHGYSGPASPHAYSAPSSPRPWSGQHSLTPPPQYTSTPPSPRQLSAPSSPHIFSPPRSPCFASGPVPMQPLSPQPPAHRFHAGPSSCQLPGPAHPFSSSAPSPVLHSANPWSVPSPLAGSSSNGEGYTCFTYNFVTPLPVETSPVLPTLHSHSSTMRYPIRDCMLPSFPPDNIRPGPHGVHAPATQAAMYPVGRAMVRASPQSQVGVQGGEVTHRTFTSRTDIQANI